MAMILCPECGKDISDRAVTCPHCGFPIGSLHGDDTVNSNSAGNDHAHDSINPKTNPADTIKCRVCGSTMAKGQRICKTCGSIIKGTEPNYYNEPSVYNNTNAEPASTANANYSCVNDIFRRSLFRRVCCPYSFFCQRFIGQYLEGIADIYQSRYARIGNNRE